MQQLLINKAFMSKQSALKLQFNQAKKSMYLHVGKKNGEEWDWQKAKLGDDEAGQILKVLEGRQKQISFYHSFKEQKKRIWVNRDDNNLVWVRIEDLRKQLNEGEQKVFEILLERAIIACSIAEVGA
ncbi:MAG: hypothetical protein ABII22_04555 [Candidatus Micrarchaeota archaeon]